MEMDVSWKKYFQDDERYADLINGIGCGGRQVIRGEDLEEADSQLACGSYPGRRRRRKGRVRVRDMVRRAKIGVNFVIIGTESQELVDYSIPLRCMVYDAGEYEKQAGKIRRKLKKQKKGLNAGEYLYGFAKASRLYPVVTFILYGGSKKWDGPRTLHEMLDFTELPVTLRRFIPDYPVNLVEIRSIEDTYELVTKYVKAGERMGKWICARH